MKRKSNLIKILAASACLLCLATGALAQKRKPAPRKTTKPAATKPTASAAAANAAEIKAGAEKVNVQIKNVTKFIYLLGSVAQGIEDIDQDIRARKASPAAAELNSKNKANVITTLRNIRAALAALETEFQAKPALRIYLLQIQGITDISAVAEDQAMAGQFIQSGKTLLQSVEKLSDTLAAMP